MAPTLDNENLFPVGQLRHAMEDRIKLDSIFTHSTSYQPPPVGMNVHVIKEIAEDIAMDGFLEASFLS